MRSGLIVSGRVPTSHGTSCSADAERASTYAIEAGDQAAHRYAHAEAAQQCQVALELLLDEMGDAARGAEVQYKLGGELYDLNRLSDALMAYEAALSNFKGLDNVLGQAFAHWGIARMYYGRYDIAFAEPHV
jgi:hypothetical protein